MAFAEPYTLAVLTDRDNAVGTLMLGLNSVIAMWLRAIRLWRSAARHRLSSTIRSARTSHRAVDADKRV
ncbi:MAG TPA: hypothetical protein V6D26_12740 [Stenomitos sp.]